MERPKALHASPTGTSFGVGSRRISALFGSILLLWFVPLAITAAGRRDGAPVGVFLIAPHNRYAMAFEELVGRCGSTFSAIWFVSVQTEPRPRVPSSERLTESVVADGVIRVEVASGYLQRIDLPELFEPVFREHGINPADVSYIVSLHRSVVASHHGRPVARAMLALYSTMAHLAARETDAWQLPRERTVEVGVPQVLEVQTRLP